MGKDLLHRPICDLLQCRYPILSAGMGGVARAELTAAVSKAGGFGCLGMVREPAELIAREIRAVRAITNNAFGVNLIPSATDPDLFKDQLAACREEKVHTLTFFWDVCPNSIAVAKSGGSRVLYQVGSVEDALKAEAAVADAVIVQGFEAGGHVRGSISSLVLLPLVANAIDIPVLGSGGFASGASLVAAFALGAQGIHCGTTFVATKESFAHDFHKQRIVGANAQDTVHTDAFGINWPPASPVRVLKNSVTETLKGNLYGYDSDAIEREVIANEQGRDIYRFSTDSPLRSMTGDLESLALFAGQVAGQVVQIEGAGKVVERIAEEARSVLAGLN